MDYREKMISASLKYDGDYFKTLKAISTNEKLEVAKGIQCITILDENYPKGLRELKYPPLVLFYKGNLELLNKEMIGVVGSRKACNYAKDATSALVRHYKDKVIVSGLAKGIDALSHQAANKTIAILGCGIDYIYPFENYELFKKIEKEGLILSEYPGKTKPLAYHFPFRNRIIAALSNTIYVMQSSPKSGTVTTINEALELGKDIKVLPFDIFNTEGEYNNQLINEGAQLILIDELTY